MVKLIQTVSDSDLTGFQYEENGVKLKIQKEKEQTVVTTGMVQNVSLPQAGAEVGEMSQTKAAEKAEGQLIKSPLVGTFYAAPSEEAAPFVAVGDHVAKGQTVAIVEAMKLMNDIECDFDGVVSEILVKNGETVEYGQPLFRIA